MKRLFTLTLLLLLTACSSAPSGGSSPTPEDPTTNKVIDAKGTILGLFIEKTSDYVLIQTSKGYKYAVNLTPQSGLSQGNGVYYAFSTIATTNSSEIDPINNKTYIIPPNEALTGNSDKFAQPYANAGNPPVGLDILCNNDTNYRQVNSLYSYVFGNKYASGYNYDYLYPVYTNFGSSTQNYQLALYATSCTVDETGINPYEHISGMVIYLPFTVNGQQI